MTTSELRLSVDQENALRESTQTGWWYPQDTEDRKVAEYLRRHDLFWRSADRARNGYQLTAAGRDWLDMHPVAGYPMYDQDFPGGW